MTHCAKLQPSLEKKSALERVAFSQMVKSGTLYRFGVDKGVTVPILLIARDGKEPSKTPSKNRTQHNRNSEKKNEQKTSWVRFNRRNAATQVAKAFGLAELCSMKPEIDMLTHEEAAAFLGVHKKTLARWYAEGIGPPRIKVGSKLRYIRASLEAWLRSKEVTPCRER